VAMAASGSLYAQYGGYGYVAMAACGAVGAVLAMLLARRWSGAGLLQAA